MYVCMVKLKGILNRPATDYLFAVFKFIERLQIIHDHYNQEQYCLLVAVSMIVFTYDRLEAHNKQIHFPPPVDSFIYQLTTDGYFTVHSCFPHSLFLWPIWHPQVHGCFLNGSGGS